MTSHLIRHARLVPLAPGDGAPDHPIDVLVEHGTVTAVGPDLDRPNGVEETDAEGRWLTPGLWDQHVRRSGRWRRNASTWPSPVPRGRDAGGGRAGCWSTPELPVIGWGHRSGGWDREVTVSGSTRSPATPRSSSSAATVTTRLNTTALMHLALPVRDSVVREGEWFAAYGRPQHAGRQRRHLARGVPPHPEHAAGLGVVGIVDFEFSGGA